MLVGGFRDLFTAIASSAASLAGLLFVAVTVAERADASSLRRVAREVSAAAALLSFVNALTVSLFSLVPGTDVGYPAVVVGLIGLLFSAAALRSLLSLRGSPRPGATRSVPHLVLTSFLFVVFGVEVVQGFMLLANPRDSDALQGISYILVASVLIGIARSWELVGGRDTGVVASFMVLVGRQPPGRDDAPEAPPAEPERPE